MYKHQTTLRVRYAETDQMGFVYYGNYATYLEVARVETLRSIGVSYKSLEDQGIMLPVINYSIDFKAPANYDDELSVETQISSLPQAKIKFEYEIKREGTLICTAETILVFMNSKSKRPIKCPAKVLEALSKWF